MPDPVLRQPTLVSVPPAGGGPPKLRARRCACGRVQHPPQSYGCEKCGRDGSLGEAIDIDARGVLTALAVVHLHPKLPTPFTIGRVTLDAGPVVDVWLDGTPVIGARVHAKLVAGTVSSAESGETSVLDVRFVVDGGP